MLEEIAIQYISQTEESIHLLSFGITIAGAVLSAIFHKSDLELRRAPYFAYTGILLFISAVSQFVWLGSVQAITGGFLWVFMLVDVVVGLATGYGFGIIAMARSRDAYGHARLAALSFIPIANFWLLLTPSKTELSAKRAPTIPLLTGSVGVLTGFVLLVASMGLSGLIQVETERIVAKAGNEPTMQRASIEMMLRGQGLEKALRKMAAEVPSQRIDEVTTLKRVLGDGTTLRYIYEISADLDALPRSTRFSLVQHNCEYEALRPVIEEGAIVEHVYQRTDGSEIGVVTITPDVCNY